MSIGTLPAAANDVNPKADWDNPFCAAVGQLFPWDRTRNAATDGATDAYVLMLWTKARSRVSGRVTLIDAFSAYSVDVPNVEIPKDEVGGDGMRPFFITFDHPVAIAANFVDAVSVDDAPLTDCPSYVQTINRASNWPSGTGLPSVGVASLHARFLQTLPSGNCAKAFTPLRMDRGIEPIVGHFGDRRRDTEVRVFVDSSGRVVETRVWNSSGVEGLDQAAVGAAQVSKYKPATFLCTPVVSDGIFGWDYEP